jgi:membrane protease YdiL (CAAX protease family)
MSRSVTPPLLSASPYWRETLRPWPNLVFVAPWLLVYEVGVWCSQTPAARNGADAWLRETLMSWGAPGGWVLPVAVVLVLLVWHLGSQHSWKLRWETPLGMFAESLLFACGLILIGQTADLLARQSGALSVCQLQPWPLSPPLRVLGFLGAGIYEEFLFRLCLLPAAYGVFRGLLTPQRFAWAGAVVVTSVVFALAHYLTPGGEFTALSVLTDAVAEVQSRRELWFGFGFRLLAGLLFAILFCTRGFGIAMGTHAVYDVVVGWVLVSEL